MTGTVCDNGSVRTSSTRTTAAGRCALLLPAVASSANSDKIAVLQILVRVHERQ
jgi:hypothetical protein